MSKFASIAPALQPSANFGTLLSGVSGIVQGVGQNIAAGQQEDLGNRNAQVFQQQAQAQRQSAKLLEFQKRKVIKSRISTQVSAAGSSGFGFSGDPLTIMQESLANAELDLAVDRFNSQVQERRFQSQADRARFEAGQAAARSRTGAARSFLGAAASLHTSQRKLGV